MTFFNPSPMPSPEQLQTLPWETVDWLIVNEGEAESLLNALGPNAQRQKMQGVPSNWPPHPTLTSAYSLLHSLRTLSSFPSSANLLCTLGALGVIVLFAEYEAIHVPAAKLVNPVLDTTGAGDCFAGYFVAGFMQYWRGESTAAIGLGELEEIVKVAVKVSQGGRRALPVYD